MLQGNIDISFRVKGHKGASFANLAGLRISFSWSAHARPSDLSLGIGRRGHGVLYKYPQSARRTFHNVYVPNLLSPLLSFSTSNPTPLVRHLTYSGHIVRFKIIADDGTIVLMPRESLAAHDEAHVTL